MLPCGVKELAKEAKFLDMFVCYIEAENQNHR